MKSQSKLSLIACLVLVVTLSACGGSSARHDVLPAQPDKPVETMIDAFTKFVMGLVATAPDNTEAASIDAVSVTTPDDIEPIAVNN